MNNYTVLSVNDLVKALKSRIDNYKGGITAIWKQLDNRFKSEETKSITGQKIKTPNKINFDAFKKAYQRFGEKEYLTKLEKMSFGITGNPLLLMNVFEILGIKSYSELMKIEYKKPDTLDEIISNGMLLESINNKIDLLEEKIANTHRKSIRTIKICTDFENLLYRLYSVLNNNVDPSLEDINYLYQVQSTINNNNFEIKALEALKNENVEKYSKYKKLHQSTTITNNLIKYLISARFLNQNSEAKRITSLLLIFHDYKRYIYKNKLLLLFLKRIENIVVNNEDCLIHSDCIISPIFLLYLLLQITLLHTKKLSNDVFITDSQTIDALENIFQIDNIKSYLLEVINDFNRKIKVFLKYFIQYEIKDISNKNYDKYIDFTKEIIDFLYNIFLVEKKIDFDKISLELNENKSIKELYKMKNNYYPGTYNISLDNIEKINILLNNASDLIQATVRDLNA
jgi:hypothetical protein